MSRDVCLECRAFLYYVDAEYFTDDCVLFEPYHLPEEVEDDD